MQCIKMLNLLMLKLIKHLTTISKGLRWGTKSLFLFLPLLRDQLSFTTEEGGCSTTLLLCPLDCDRAKISYTPDFCFFFLYI